MNDKFEKLPDGRFIIRAEDEGLWVAAYNHGIETAAALLELDDEILPYTIEQIRKLKK